MSPKTILTCTPIPMSGKTMCPLYPCIRNALEEGKFSNKQILHEKKIKIRICSVRCVYVLTKGRSIWKS